MTWLRKLLVLAIVVAAAAPAPAQSLFGKRKPPANPDQHVQQLLATVETAPETNKRASAAKELRDFSTSTYPQIVPVLVNALRNDKSVAVRIEAAQSLGRLRPLTKTAGEALAEAALKDPAIRVRWQSRTSLTFYNVAGLNPNNYESGDSPLPKASISLKEVPVTNTESPVLVPKPGATVIVPGGATPPGSTGYSLPLPKGPASVPESAPLPGLQTPPPVENIPPTTPVVPGPALDPVPPPATPPASDLPPVVIPDVGPILAPPPK